MLISPNYLEQNRLLHQRPTYGAGGHQHLDEIETLVLREGPIRSVIDYGAGKGTFKPVFEQRFPFIPVQNYDPVTFPCNPHPSDLIVCTDVLEHIEPDCLDDVLLHVSMLMNKIGFFTIATRPAQKTLPDGRNAHLIQESEDWWREKLQMFHVKHWEADGREIQTVVRRKENTL